MCEKAEEIQGEWQPTVGDYICIKPGEEVVDNLLKALGVDKAPVYIIDSDVSLKQSPEYIKSRHTWLPRQGQLQEMVVKDTFKESVWAFVGKFTWDGDRSIPAWAVSNELDEHRVLGTLFRFTSMEQLWLAFVMTDRFGKHWNGEEWIKEAT